MPSTLTFCRDLPVASFGPGDVLFAEGGRTGILYILAEGEIEVVKGDFQISTVSEPGAIFGELSVLLDIPHTATVKAVTACTAHVVRHAVEFLQSKPEITYELACLLARRLHGVSAYLVDVKKQFEDQTDHLGMVDVVLESLVHQQNEECTPGSDRDPDTAI
jgi:CRP-like cAMP-binding protein